MLLSLQGNFNYIVIQPTKYSNVIRLVILTALPLHLPPTNKQATGVTSPVDFKELILPHLAPFFIPDSPRAGKPSVMNQDFVSPTSAVATNSFTQFNTSSSYSSPISTPTPPIDIAYDTNISLVHHVPSRTETHTRKSTRLKVPPAC